MWKGIAIRYDGKIQTYEDEEVEAIEYGWVRLFETETLVIDEWQGAVNPAYFHFYIYLKETP